jgi:hemerythrin-like domain-containing protein
MVKRDKRLVRLTQEHHKALVMALRIERDLPPAGDGEVAALFDDVVAFWQVSLLRHFRTENECLLTRLVRHVPLDNEDVARVCRDHIRLDGLVTAMRDDVSTETRRQRLTEFGELLREHVHWEEDVLFEKTQQLLESSELDALGSDISERIPAEFDFPAERLYPREPRNPRVFGGRAPRAEGMDR